MTMERPFLSSVEVRAPHAIDEKQNVEDVPLVDTTGEKRSLEFFNRADELARLKIHYPVPTPTDDPQIIPATGPSNIERSPVIQTTDTLDGVKPDFFRKTGR